MNGDPHVHEPLVCRRWGDYSRWRNPWVVKYGDTYARVCSRLRTPTPRQVKRATRRAIAQHDAGSRDAVARVRAIARLQRDAQAVVSAWGHRQL